MQHVVVIGGGFAGLRVVRGLAKAPVRITLVERTNHHCFQPLLYEVATGSLAPGEIAPPLRWVLRSQMNVEVLLAEVETIDADASTITATTLTGERRVLGYDHLVVAAGARHSYFGHEEWAPFAPGLKDVDDALELRRRIFGAFERAEVARDEAELRRYLTFVVIGAGPTGVELAGQLVEIANKTIRREFRDFDAALVRVLLVDAGPRVLAGFDEQLSEHARRQLEQMGVVVRTSARVEAVDEHGVHLAGETIDAATIVWAAGVQGSPLAQQLAETSGAELDRAGRIHVEPDFTLVGRERIRVIGDLAATGLPGVAPVAMQQGTWTARSIAATVRERPAPKPFVYRDRGSMATIGRRRAVAHIAGLRLHGTIAWLAWLFVHLMYVVGFANRLLVLVRWMARYVANGRGERVLTELPPASPAAPPS